MASNLVGRFASGDHPVVTPPRRRWGDDDPTANNYGGIVYFAQGSVFNPCLKFDPEEQSFAILPQSLAKPKLKPFLTSVNTHIADLVTAQKSVGRLFARNVGRFASGFFVDKNYFLTRAHLWQTDQEFELHAQTDTYTITLKSDGSAENVDAFLTHNLDAIFVGKDDYNDLAVFRVDTGVDKVIPVTVFQGNPPIQAGDNIVTIGYNGMPTESNLKKLYDSVQPGEDKPPIPPNVYLAISILHPDQKSLSAGTVRSIASGGLLFGTLSLESGSSGSPAFVLRDGKPPQLIGSVFGNSPGFSVNKITLFQQEDVDSIANIIHGSQTSPASTTTAGTSSSTQ